MIIEPSTDLTSFNCPHCKALAQQFWFSLRALNFDKDKSPSVWTSEEAEATIKEWKKDADADGSLATYVRKLATGEPFLAEKGEHGWSRDLSNAHISQCYNCDKIAVWVYGRLLYPANLVAVESNADMPEDVAVDFKEAALVSQISSRGAAALLRLAIQRLMPHVGERGENLNDDIGELVKKGLDARIQQALDVVRVVGNNAVHPGQIDLKDDARTVATLFRLTNLIVDTLISQPKHIEAAFAGLPEGARKAIAKRDEIKPKTSQH